MVDNLYSLTINNDIKKIVMNFANIKYKIDNPSINKSDDAASVQI